MIIEYKGAGGASAEDAPNPIAEAFAGAEQTTTEDTQISDGAIPETEEDEVETSEDKETEPEKEPEPAPMAVAPDYNPMLDIEALKMDMNLLKNEIASMNDAIVSLHNAIGVFVEGGATIQENDSIDTAFTDTVITEKDEEFTPIERMDFTI